MTNRNMTSRSHLKSNIWNKPSVEPDEVEQQFSQLGKIVAIIDKARRADQKRQHRPDDAVIDVMARYFPIVVKALPESKKQYYRILTYANECQEGWSNFKRQFLPAKITKGVFKIDFTDRLQQMKRHLQSKPHKSITYADNDDFFTQNIDEKIDEMDEKLAHEWNLCESKRRGKSYKFVCGKFGINEDLQTFRSKVVKKAAVVIACYKRRLAECEKQKTLLAAQLARYQECLTILKKRLSEVRQQKSFQHTYKNQIREKLTQCEKSVKSDRNKIHRQDLYQNLCHLEKDLMTNSQNHRESLHQETIIKSQIAEKKSLIMEHECNQHQLLQEISNLKSKVLLLMSQNEQLKLENQDLKQNLGDTLATLKSLCGKYYALKKKCQNIDSDAISDTIPLRKICLTSSQSSDANNIDSDGINNHSQ